MRALLVVAVLLVASAALAGPLPKPPQTQSLIVKVFNWSCGLKPLPPMGCQIGACVCDEDGDNCSWQTICD
jgi:hypothetical protein